jgi:hypothetical protein
MTEAQAQALKVQITLFSIQLTLALMSGDKEAGKAASLGLVQYIDTLVVK